VSSAFTKTKKGRDKHANSNNNVLYNHVNLRDNASRLSFHRGTAIHNPKDHNQKSIIKKGITTPRVKTSIPKPQPQTSNYKTLNLNPKSLPIKSDLRKII